MGAQPFEHFSFRPLRPNEVEDALALVWKVFQEFEGPDYPPEGMSSFRHDIIDNAEYKKSLQSGECPMYVAVASNKIVSVIAFRASRDHLSLAFTDKQFQRQGIGARLFEVALSDLASRNPSLKQITVHSSPYGVGFYKKLSFVQTSKQKQTNGIIFVPMKYVVNKRRD